MPFTLGVSMLPKDEYEASVMMREGLLDSLDWERIRQFYVQPLNVPSGDLRYLRELTELWVEDIPVIPAEIAPYEPWAEKDIKRFFSDYPQLLAFEPILSFATERSEHGSSASLSVHTDQTQQPNALSRFESGIDPRYSISGSIYNEDSTLLWRTRRIRVAVPGIGSVEGGNFTTADDRGLFFGYFPDDKAVKTSASNWMYGGTRTWNGVRATADCGDRIRVSGFFHQRRTEVAQSLECSADVGTLTEIMAGISRVSQTSSVPAPESTLYVNGGIQGRLAKFDVSVHSGIDIAHPQAIPMSAQVGRKTAEGSVKFLVARIPGSLRLPLSSIAYLCRRDLDTVGQNGTFPDVTLLECRTSLCTWAGSETSMEVISAFHGHGAEILATARVQGSLPVDYHLEYSCRALTDKSQTIHSVNFAVQGAVRKGSSLGLSCRYYCRDNGFQSVFVRTPLDIAILSGITVSPFLTYFSNTEREHAAGAGLKQTLHCFDKTWCEWSGQVSWDEHDALDWNVGVRTDFLF